MCAPLMSLYVDAITIHPSDPVQKPHFQWLWLTSEIAKFEKTASFETVPEAALEAEAPAAQGCVLSDARQSLCRQSTDYLVALRDFMLAGASWGDDRISTRALQGGEAFCRSEGQALPNQWTREASRKTQFFYYLLYFRLHVLNLTGLCT